VKRCRRKSSTRGSGNSESKSSTEWLDGDVAYFHFERSGNASQAVAVFRAGYEVKIVDDKENWCVTVRSAIFGARRKRVCGVLAHPELTARTKREDWIATGDKFICDSHGYYTTAGVRTIC